MSNANVPNGFSHLAIATKDLNAQIEFFTQVLGLELAALIPMHGAEQCVHAFLKLNDTTYLAFVYDPNFERIPSEVGVSRPSWTAGDVAPGAMQHVALYVDDEAALLAMRDRLRAHGKWVMGPLEHGIGKSIYFIAPEGIMLEISDVKAINDELWIDVDVVKKLGYTADDLRRFRHPPTYEAKGGSVPQPESDAGMRFPGPLASLNGKSNEEISAVLSWPEPPHNNLSTSTV